MVGALGGWCSLDITTVEPESEEQSLKKNQNIFIIFQQNSSGS